MTSKTNHEKADKISQGALRERAEERLRYTRTEVGAMSQEEVQELVHELQVHQIELEMRNEEMAIVEAETARARDRYQTLYDLAPVGYLTLDEDLVIREANKTAAALLRTTRNGLRGGRLSHFAFDGDQDACYLCLRGVVNSQEPRTAEIRFGPDENSVFVARIYVTNTHSVEDGQRELQVALTDITDEYRSRKALRASEERYRFLYEQSQALNIVISMQGTVLDVNKNGLAVLGYKKREVLGRSPVEFVVEEQREEVHRRLRGILSGEQPMGMDLFIRAKDDSVRTYMSTPASVVIYEGAEPVGVLFNATDVTERNNAEKELQARARDLEQANHELETFAYSVSHDLRNPLNNILALAEVLNDLYGDKLDKDGRKCVRQILKSSDRMSETISDLLRLSRVARKEPELQEVNLSQLAAEIIEDLQKTNPRSDVEVVLQEGVVATADKGLIHNALHNLLDNAWKYTIDREHTRIEFGYIEKEGCRVYFVRDNGEGFDMQQAEKMFEPFRRLGTKKKVEGSGIGLSLVQRIIARHGGKVWAESEKGEGADFFFTLRT